GCPVDPCTGKPLVALVQFQYDSAVLPSPRDDDPQSMEPILESIAKAMAQDASCRVCVIGHASEEGPVDYNVTLSKERAAAVKGYLTSRGLDGKRIVTTGMGLACPLDPVDTRVQNRRVEFLRLAEGESCPTTCLD